MLFLPFQVEYFEEFVDCFVIVMEGFDGVVHVFVEEPDVFVEESRHLEEVLAQIPVSFVGDELLRLEERVFLL